MNSIARTLVILCIFILTTCSSGSSRPEPPSGSLDMDFGIVGRVTTSIRNSNDAINAVAIQTDGKIVATGSSTVDFIPVFALARYNTDGSLDTTFGTGGTTTTAFGTIWDEAHAIVMQSDGKIVVAGSSQIGYADVFALARYNPDGSLDTTFGTGGKVTTAFGDIGDWANAVAIQTDGKIVAVGFSTTTAIASVVTNVVFALARYNTDGSLDTTFGSGGKVITGGMYSWANAVAIQADGKIVAAGYYRVVSTILFSLTRYNTDGSIDMGFGTSGTVNTAFASYDVARAVTIQADGKIVAVGGSQSSTATVFALARYNTDGALDMGFGIGGKVTTAIETTWNVANAIAIQADGKIVAVGYSATGPATVYALVRYNADGSLDTKFGTGGMVTTAFGGIADFASAVAIQQDGKIVAAGGSQTDTRSVFSLGRYWP